MDNYLKLHAELEYEKESHEDTREQYQRVIDLNNGAMHQLESQLNRKQEQIKKLTDHKDILIKQAAEQQDKLNEHQQFERSQKEKINQLKKSNKKLSKKLEKLESRLAESKDKKKFWKAEYDQDQRIIAKLMLKVNNYQSIIKQKDQQLKSKRVEINRNKAQVINKQKQEISKLKSDNQSLQQQVQQEQQRADNLQLWKDSHVCVCPNICCAGDYAKVKQQLDNHKCPTIDNSELASLRIEVREKDQKIGELEAETKLLEAQIRALKDKPPVVDNSEVDRLLAVIEEKEQIIRELEVKLATAKPQKIMVESEEVQELRNKLASQEKKIVRLHAIYLLILSVGALVGLVRLVGGKKKRR